MYGSNQVFVGVLEPMLLLVGCTFFQTEMTVHREMTPKRCMITAKRIGT